MKLPHCARAALAAWLMAASAATWPVTLTGDAVPHLWHSFATPDNAFLGAAGYTGASWRNTDAGAFYAEWAGFVPAARNTWVFSRPTVGATATLTAVLTETSGTGLLTGTSNIYGLAFGQVPGPPLVFDLMLEDRSGTVFTAGQTRTIVLRAGTKGTLPDMNVLLNGVAATASATTFRVDGTIDMPTGPGGAIEANVTSDAEWLWLWQNVPAVATYRVDFKMLVGHASLDNLVVYASPARTPVPPAPVPTQRAALVPVNGLASELAAVAASQTTVILRAGRARAK